MAPPSKRQKTAEDREQETFRKRSNGVMKKIHELSIFTNTDLYLVMLREGKFKTYSSVERDGWPPSQSDIDTNYPPTERKGPADFKAIPFPTRRKRNSSLRTEPGSQPGEGSSKTFSPDAYQDLWSIGGTAKPVDHKGGAQQSGQGVYTQDKPDKFVERSDRGSGASIGVKTGGILVAEPGKCDTHDGHRNAGKPEHGQSRAIRRKFIIPKLPVFPQLIDPPPHE